MDDGFKKWIKWDRIADAAMWVSMCAAIIFAMHLTQRTTVLWFFLIPALIYWAKNE